MNQPFRIITGVVIGVAAVVGIAAVQNDLINMEQGKESMDDKRLTAILQDKEIHHLMDGDYTRNSVWLTMLFQRALAVVDAMPETTVSNVMRVGVKRDAMQR